MTVTGPVPADELGWCQSHEHILIRKGQPFAVDSALLMDEPDRSLAELCRYRDAVHRKAGSADTPVRPEILFCSVVDAQPGGCGRMASELRELSRRSGVRIIASTGFHKLCYYPEDHWIRRASADELAGWFIEELAAGMYEDDAAGRPDDLREAETVLPGYRTDIRAGQIKTAWDTGGYTGQYAVLFEAAALAHAATGVPVMIHVEQGTDPRPLMHFLRLRGVAAEKMIFCHMDRACPDLRMHMDIAAEGAYLEYDTIGRFKYHSDEEEIRIFKELIAAGCLDRLLFSLDTTRKRMGSYDGTEITLSYIAEVFLDKMEQAGIGRDAIRKIAYDNPAGAFEPERASHCI